MKSSRLQHGEYRDTAFRHMAAAYLKASDDGRLPANARQIFYAARPFMLQDLGVKELGSKHFTANLLPGYQLQRPEETADWDVVYDARGHFAEPHRGTSLDLGTIEVRNYSPTAHCFNFALFIEKEGFDELFASVNLQNRWDIALFSSKGQSTTATRHLVDELSQAGVTILIAHDFDFAGMAISHSLFHSSKRYQFQTEPTVIDLGLRLADVQPLGLESEATVIGKKKDPNYVQSKNPRETLAVYGTTREEQDFLIERFDGKAWHGQRVELNALTSRQLIEWLEAKFEEHGVEKVIPDGNVLATRWREQALPIHRDAAFIRFKENDPRQKQVVALYRKVWKLNEAIEAAFSKKYRGPRVPNDLHERIAEYFEERDRTVPWGTALFRIVEEDRKLR